MRENIFETVWLEIYLNFTKKKKDKSEIFKFGVGIMIHVMVAVRSIHQAL